MTLGIMSQVNITHPVAHPPVVDVTMSCARRDLDPIVRILLVEQLFRNYLDSSLDVFLTYPPGPQTDGGNCSPGRRRVAIHGRRR